MKNKATVLIAVMLLSAIAQAQQENKLSDEQKQQIAWAIKVLAANNVVTQDADKRIRIEPSLIDQLVKDGLLERGNSRVSSICIDGSK